MPHCLQGPVGQTKLAIAVRTTPNTRADLTISGKKYISECLDDSPLSVSWKPRTDVSNLHGMLVRKEFHILILPWCGNVSVSVYHQTELRIDIDN